MLLKAAIAGADKVRREKPPILRTEYTDPGEYTLDESPNEFPRDILSAMLPGQRRKLIDIQYFVIGMYRNPHPTRLPLRLPASHARDIPLFAPDLFVRLDPRIDLGTAQDRHPPDPTLGLRVPPVPPFSAERAAPMVDDPR